MPDQEVPKTPFQPAIREIDVSSDTRTSIATRLDGLAHVMRDQPLTVPLYQRSYSWKKEHVETYLGDLRSALNLPASDYFVGTLVLAPDKDRLVVIDGQQRLATTALLLSAIRNEFRRAGDSDRADVIERQYLASRNLRTSALEPRMHLNDIDDEVFSSILTGSKPTVAADAPDSHRRLIVALRYLEEQMQHEVDTAGPNWAVRLFDWVDFLEDRVRAIVLTVTNDADAFLIFETLNDRGLDLTIADLLKNYLFGLTRNEISSSQTTWISITESFHNIRDEEVLTQFIRHYWSSRHGATRERELYRSLRRRVRSDTQANELLESLDSAAPNYAALLDADSPQWTELGVNKDTARTLLNLGLEQNRPLLLAAMDEFEPVELAHLCEMLIAWSVRGLLVGGIGGGTYERYYADAARAIRSHKSSTASAVFETLRDIVPPDDAIIDALNGKRVNQGRLAKYYLLAYERHAAGLPNPSIVGADDDSSVNLELVIPRRPDTDIWTEINEDSLKQLSLRLGNQLLLEPDFTFRARWSWEEKREILRKSSRILAQRAAQFDSWDSDAISAIQSEFSTEAILIWPRTA